MKHPDTPDNMPVALTMRIHAETIDDVKDALIEMVGRVTTGDLAVKERTRMEQARYVTAYYFENDEPPLSGAGEGR